MARPTPQPTPAPATSTETTLPRSALPIAAVQIEHFRRIFSRLRLAPNRSGGLVEQAEMDIRRPIGCEGLLAFPRPSALARNFREALLRLWHVCLAEYQVLGVKNQSADPPDPNLFPESCQDFHARGLGVAYGDFCVVPIQLGLAHRHLSPMQAYATTERTNERPLFAYEVLALLVGIPEIAVQIREGRAALRLVERVRNNLDPTVRLLRRKSGRYVPEFAVLSGDRKRILLSGEPSPNKIPDGSGGFGLATRFPITAANAGR